jgi:hypothetical protein
MYVGVILLLFVEAFAFVTIPLVLIFSLKR